MPEPVTAVIEQLHRRASVDTVYGDPIDVDGRTIVPVAKIAYGFGGGYGSDDGYDDGGGADDGGGFGGGISAKPVGVVELRDGETTFVRLDRGRRTVALAVCALLIGYALGKRR